MTYYFIYAITLGFAVVYSYVLLDPNITFINHPLWTAFRDAAVHVGYHNRPVSTALYISIIIAFSAFHWWSMRLNKTNPFLIALLVGGILTFSYPFLSHDLFNYMFDAKILTLYHQNPYYHAALDYPSDTWLRFMHWIHRPYPYGPVFLAFTVVPAFLGMGKFIIHYFLIKVLFTFFYLAAVYFMQRIDPKYGMLVATHPLILVEGLISSHNEVLALALGVMGLYFMSRNKGVISAILLTASAGIKFMSFPVMLIERYKYKWLNYTSFFLMLALLAYVTVKVEIQPWYFINLFLYVPLFPELIKRLQVFFTGLLLSYYPYLMLGGWDSQDKIDIKHWIIGAGCILNAVYLLYVIRKSRKGWRFLLNETWSAKEHT